MPGHSFMDDRNSSLDFFGNIDMLALNKLYQIVSPCLLTLYRYMGVYLFTVVGPGSLNRWYDSGA